MSSTPPTRVPTLRPIDAEPSIGLRAAVVTWAVSWFAGNVLGASVLSAIDPDAGSTPVWATALAAVALWVPILIGLREVSVRHGTGRVDRDLGLRFAPVDLLGVPIGVLTQLVLLRLVYWPLQELWPDTFSSQRLERSARDLYESADGAWLVVLVLVVVVGAPLVEELLYRGLLQQAFARRIDDVLAVVVVSAWFALIHFRPVEYPGLFVVGLVFGIGVLVTRRLGMSVIAHCAFNATGLLWIASR